MMAVVETGFTFRESGCFALAALVIVVAWLRIRQRRAVMLAASAVWPEQSAALPRTWRQRLASLPLLLEVCALLLMLTALARPVTIEAEPPRRFGRDVLLCVDRSSSMAADDLSSGNSRLVIGKQLGAEFMLAREHDRLGVVTFARYADLVCPPTVDHAAAAELLAGVELVDSEGPEDATAIGAAVGMAANLLQRSQANGKVIVLLTDGEENVAVAGADDQIAPLHAGQWCRDHGIRVHCIALGVGQSLDTTAVQQLAKLTGGRFFKASDEQALRAVYAAIDRLESAQFAEPGVHVNEWYALPLALGLLLLWLSHLHRCARWAVQP